jgi:drug/metabolite transporter (DMT)-like permease
MAAVTRAYNFAARSIPTALDLIHVCRLQTAAWALKERRMKASGWIGVVLIVVGIIALAWGGITYTHKKKIINMGPIQASHKEKKTIPLPPVLGIVCIIAGGGLVIAGNRK